MTGFSSPLPRAGRSSTETTALKQKASPSSVDVRALTASPAPCSRQRLRRGAGRAPRTSSFVKAARHVRIHVLCDQQKPVRLPQRQPKRLCHIKIADAARQQPQAAQCAAHIPLIHGCYATSLPSNFSVILRKSFRSSATSSSFSMRSRAINAGAEKQNFPRSRSP